jgi:hypothetical protein
MNEQQYNVLLAAIHSVEKRLAELERRVEELGGKISPKTLAEAFYEMPIPPITE